VIGREKAMIENAPTNIQAATARVEKITQAILALVRST
jgi:hypothetical protein